MFTPFLSNMPSLSTLLLLWGAVGLSMAADDNGENPLRAVSAGIEHFSINLFKEIAKEKKGQNLISSPLSVDIVMAMAANGAAGNTAKQIREALNLSATEKTSNQGFKDLTAYLSNMKNVSLEVANKMYVANGLKLKSEFRDVSRNAFSSETDELDVSQPEKAAEKINSWVQEKTHGKIEKIFENSDIDGDTRVVLLNAIYFKSSWASKFFDAEHTRNKDFHLDNKNKKNVPTMYTEGEFHHGVMQDLGATFVELPYANENLKIVIIVPTEINGLGKVIENLESFNSTRLAESGMTENIDIFLPKFKIESDIDLREPLQNLGMTDMFEGVADFSNISEEKLKVSKVVQKAFLEVNEEGSEAAAATGATIQFLSLPPRIVADRPFLFKIVDKSSDAVLFIGSVVNP